jgi:uncharacterized protein (DUF4415 family)
MSRSEALRAARRLFGKQAYVSELRHPSSPTLREQAVMKQRAAVWRLAEIDQEIKERLAALPWYEALVEERRRVTKAKQDGMGWAHYYRCRLIVDEKVFAAIKAEGDTWQETIDTAKRRKRGA